jgi:hypothetical protein
MSHCTERNHAALIDVMARWGMGMTCRIVAAIAVAANWGGPADWLRMFGRWAD